MLGNNGDDAGAIASYIERIEGLEAEKKRTAEAIKAVYSSAATDGVDVDALKFLVKERKSDMEKTAKVRVAVDRMRKALGGLAGTELGEWAAAVAAAQTTARKRGTPKALLDA